MKKNLNDEIKRISSIMGINESTLPEFMHAENLFNKTLKDQVKVVDTPTNPIVKSSQNVDYDQASINEAKSFASLTNKKGLINFIYRLISQYTASLYHDEHWGGVQIIIDTIRNIDGVTDVSYWAPNGGYRKNYEGVQWKEYMLKIETVQGIVIEGQINAHAAGSVEDPFDRYDITVVLW